MTDDDYEKKVADRKAVLQQQEAAKKRGDQPRPEYKPESARGKPAHHIAKTESQIERQAAQDVWRKDAQEAKAKAQFKREKPFEAAVASEPAKNLNQNAGRAQPEAKADKPRQSFKDYKAQLKAQFKDAGQSKENETKRDRKFGSRFLDDEERER